MEGINMRRILASAFGTVAFLANCLGARAQTSNPDRVSVTERLLVASKIYASVQLYFAHWQAVPDLDFDGLYKHYLDQIAHSDDRQAFDLASLEFLAALKNGHTSFSDDWLRNNYGQPLGFSLTKVDGQWIVTSSQIKDLSLGEVVEAIDDVAFEQFFKQKRKYISESSERAQRSSLFYSSHLFPESFVLRLKDGRTVHVDRKGQQLLSAPSVHWEARMLRTDVAYIRIPSFQDSENETQAVEFLKTHAKISVVIFDVRGNAGGSTPSSLLRAVMDRPYRDWTQTSTLNIGLFGAYDHLSDAIPRDRLDERTKGYFDAFKEYFRWPQFVAQGALVKPEDPIFTAKVLVLADSGCASACEDFVMPVKFSHRATVLGDATYGSSGQPFFYEFGNGMGFRVGAKRLLLPDGSEFEGVGIAPDFVIQPSIRDIQKGVDVVLNRAKVMTGLSGTDSSATRYEKSCGECVVDRVTPEK
jgi:carboxyl-terminal processing protease